jgi:hypothetical protein
MRLSNLTDLLNPSSFPDRKTSNVGALGIDPTEAAATASLAEDERLEEVSAIQRLLERLMSDSFDSSDLHRQRAQLGFR